MSLLVLASTGQVCIWYHLRNFQCGGYYIQDAPEFWITREDYLEEGVSCLSKCGQAWLFEVSLPPLAVLRVEIVTSKTMREQDITKANGALSGDHMPAI